MLVLMSRATSTARPHTEHFNSSPYVIFLNNSLRDITTIINSHLQVNFNEVKKLTQGTKQ